MRPAALGLLLLGCGCAPLGSFFLVVEAPLRVPDPCNALRVEVRRGDAAGPVRYDHTYDLKGGPDFPLTLEVNAAKTEDLAPSTLHVSVWALKGAALVAPWSLGSGDVTATAKAEPTLTISLCDCAR